MHPRNILIKFSVVVLAFSATPKLLSEAFTTLPVLAQAFGTTSFPLPASLPDGTNIKVDGSTSMKAANQSVKQRLEEKFAGSTVTLAENGSDQAVQDLLNGNIAVASIGRLLTDEEKAKGLKEARITREKIAIIVSPDNPYSGDITFEQFAKIFRGEITDWSEVGGAAGPIRLIDRPESSDTRRSFQTYPVFQTAPFQTGANATQVADDQTATVIQALGKDGISYAIADQVIGDNSVKIIPMHQTLPDDIRYPFSQPRLFVYRDAADPAAAAFLGLATTAPGQEVVAAAVPPSPAAVVPPSPAAVPPSPVAQAPAAAVAETQTGGGFPWWLLGLPLLGGLLWWLSRGRSPAPVAVPPAPVPVAAPPAPVPVVPPPPVVRVPEGRIILAPRDCRNAYAYWEVEDARKAQLREQGGKRMAVRLYDVTGIDMDRQVPHSVKQFDCTHAEPDLHIPIATDDRDYVAELGYVTEDGRWLKVTRSEHVRVPACPVEPKVAPKVEPKIEPKIEPKVVAAPVVEPPKVEVPKVEIPKVSVPPLVTGAALAGGAAVVGAALSNAAKTPEPPAPVVPAKPPEPIAPVIPESRLILTPREDAQQHAYAYWEAPDAAKEALKRQGGQQFMLRLHDVTGLDVHKALPPAIEQFNCAEADQDRHLSIPHFNRDYLAEIGYLTPEGRWLELARSNSIRVVATAAAGETANLVAPVVPAPVAPAPVAPVVPAPVVPAPVAPVVPAPVVSAPVVPALATAATIATAATAATVTPSPAVSSPCAIQTITVDSQRNCYLLNEGQMHHLQHEKAVTKALQPGTHLVRIKSGAFGYGLTKENHEPIVILWIHGGRVINQQTEVPVAATWATLNGYDDTLTLKVLEPATLHAFFFDTHVEDNDDEVVLSVVSLPDA